MPSAATSAATHAAEPFWTANMSAVTPFLWAHARGSSNSRNQAQGSVTAPHSGCAGRTVRAQLGPHLLLHVHLYPVNSQQHRDATSVTVLCSIHERCEATAPLAPHHVAARRAASASHTSLARVDVSVVAHRVILHIHINVLKCQQQRHARGIPVSCSTHERCVAVLLTGDNGDQTRGFVGVTLQRQSRHCWSIVLRSFARSRRWLHGGERQAGLQHTSHGRSPQLP